MFCREDDSSDTCAALMQKFDTLTAGMDPYALDFPVCTDSAASAGRHERHTLAKAMGKLGATPFIDLCIGPSIIVFLSLIISLSL